MDSLSDTSSEDEQTGIEANALPTYASPLNVKPVFDVLSAAAKPIKHKKTKHSQSPMNPVVSQLVEMGFSRKSVEFAEKALGVCIFD